MNRLRPALAALRLALLGLLFGAVPAKAEEPVLAVGRINNSAGSYCSGILLTPRIAVTAAHCLWNGRTQRWLRPEAIHFLAGFDRGTYVFHAVAQSYRTSSTYDPARPFETLAEDWALLAFSQDAPSTIALPQLGPAPKTDETLTTLGFARERPYRLGRSAPCSLKARSPRGLFATTCQASHGFSGGPLRDDDGRLLGILVAGHEDGTGGLVVPAAAWQKTFEELSQPTDAAVDLAVEPVKSGMLPR